MSTNETAISDEPWNESGAMVYVALTIATFSALTMCCVYIISHHPKFRSCCRFGTAYTSLDEDKVELQTRDSDSPTHSIEDIREETDEHKTAAVFAVANAVAESDQSAFSFDHSDTESDEEDTRGESAPSILV